VDWRGLRWITVMIPMTDFRASRPSRRIAAIVFFLSAQLARSLGGENRS
jgi:hypothetical protein